MTARWTLGLGRHVSEMAPSGQNRQLCSEPGRLTWPPRRPREKFRAQDAEGPTWVARFFSPAGESEFERLRLDAFMTIQEVLRLTG